MSCFRFRDGLIALYQQMPTMVVGICRPRAFDSSKNPAERPFWGENEKHLITSAQVSMAT
jgi:hypothetical protein